MVGKIIPITVAKGDGIGPEIMQATLDILFAAGANIEVHEVEIGEKIYLKGHKIGIEEKTWETLKNTKAFLKAPITTPQGGGFKSLNVTIRTALGLYANIRPCVSYFPFVATKHPKMDLVIVRENEEDLYLGIEYRQTPDVFHALKLISHLGSEKIIRYAFEYALNNNRKKVTCFTKDNILKLTDGHFHKTFDQIAKEYPTLQNEHWIVDIGAAKLADTPEDFDIIVMPNLYGDILSDVAAQISGSVGLAGSANIGELGAMFEAIHGSAPRRANQDVANPSGLLLAAIQMLVYLGDSEIAATVHNAWLKTVEEGIHTYDIFDEKVSRVKVGTKAFAKAVIERLGQKPDQLKAVSYKSHPIKIKLSPFPNPKREIVGFDLYVYHKGVVDSLDIPKNPRFELSFISNRGTHVWPKHHTQTSCIDEWRLRFFAKTPSQQEIFEFLASLDLDIIKVENLYTFDGENGFSN